MADCVWLLPTLARPGQLEAHSPLPTRVVRLSRKRQQSPWVAMADTQSVSLGCLTHWAGGFDGGKWVKGRKRHVLVDSMGLLLAVVVTAAKLTSKGCRLCCAGSSSGEAGSIGCGSSGATGPMGNTCCSSGSWSSSTACWKCWSSPEAVLSEWCPELCSWSAPWPGFPGAGRLSQNDDKLPRTWETFIYLAMIELMLKRVAETLATSKTPSEEVSKILYAFLKKFKE